MEKLLNLQDQYKFPMGQLIYEKEPEAEVTFTMHNRKKSMRIADFVTPEELQDYYDELRDLSFTAKELAVLERQTDKRYTREFLGYLAAFRLPEIIVSIDQENNDLTATTTGRWNDASLWEIPMLSALPELYYPRFITANGGTVAQVKNEGNQRLDATITLMKAYPGLTFAEFGTRRRFSSEWQDHAVGRFAEECPDNLLGTSNPYLADKYGVPASGTNAHELGMVYAALNETRGKNPLDGQNQVISDWLERFPSMPVVLTDTFTTDVTLASLNEEQIATVKSFRIDSGNEYEIGCKIVAFLKSHGIDPLERTLFFSNSLNPAKALAIYRYFEGIIHTAFGIGGHAVNDMGFDIAHDLPGMNIVSKAVSVNGHGTVKLSDDAGKHTGKPQDIARYQSLISTCLKELVASRPLTHVR